MQEASGSSLYAVRNSRNCNNFRRSTALFISVLSGIFPTKSAYPVPLNRRRERLHLDAIALVPSFAATDTGESRAHHRHNSAMGCGSLKAPTKNLGEFSKVSTVEHGEVVSSDLDHLNSLLGDLSPSIRSLVERGSDAFGLDRGSQECDPTRITRQTIQI